MTPHIFVHNYRKAIHFTLYHDRKCYHVYYLLAYCPLPVGQLCLLACCRSACLISFKYDDGALVSDNVMINLVCPWLSKGVF